ncbi:putative LRR receptor-like serine/threonine-protein [Sesbania bispinosa]|nr:putative LRR receptor-like serine/threonine-protein [Sesbania bispinosa]
MGNRLVSKSEHKKSLFDGTGKSIKKTVVIDFLITVVAYFTLTLTFAQSNNNVSHSEIQALTAFKLNLHDPLGFLRWMRPSTPSTLCHWWHLCFKNRVHELRLPRLQLTGPLSPSPLSKLLRPSKTIKNH